MNERTTVNQDTRKIDQMKIILMSMAFFAAIITLVFACGLSDGTDASGPVVFTEGDYKYETTSDVEYTVKVIDRSVSITDLVIPSTVTHDSIEYTVTAIGGYAFDYSDVKTVKIPDSVTSVGDSAFLGCADLTSVNFGNGIESIGPCAFQYCKRLISTEESMLVFPASLKSIDNQAFYQCDGLESIKIPDSVISIGEESFYECEYLTKLIISQNLTIISRAAFYGCSSLQKVDIPESVTTLELGAFCLCTSLKNISISDNMESIGMYVFCECTSLETVYLGSKVPTIEDYAFSNCTSLKKITNDNLTPIHLDAHTFAGHPLDTELIVPSDSYSLYLVADVWKDFLIGSIVDVPEAVDGLVYNRTPQTGVYEDFGYTVTNNIKTDAGEYTATVTLNPHFRWTDGTQKTVYVAWTISQNYVTISGITAEDKVYDRTKSATLNFSSVVIEGKYGGDDLSVTANGTFLDANTGENKTVKISDYALTGTSAKNYLLRTTGLQPHTTATITKKDITISGITAEGKIYDRTTAASLIYTGAVFNGLITPDSLTIEATGTFDNFNVGVSKTVTISNLVLGGPSIDNYKLAATGHQDSTTATITEREVVISGITAEDKVYDSTTDAGLIFTEVSFIGKIDPDSLTITATGSFEDIYAGKDKDVAISALILGGSSVGNYKLAATGHQESTTATITQKEIVVSGITAEGRIYNGTTNATLNYTGASFTGLLGADSLDVTAIGTFDNANAGTDKTVDITGLVLGGLSVNNYKLATIGQQDSTTATITQKEVVVSGITAEDKAYDRTTSATLIYSAAIFSGIVDNDVLTVTANATFNSANAEENKIVLITDLVIGGPSVGNYKLAATGHQESTTATIMKKDVTINGLYANDKTYDGTTAATIVCTGAVFSGKYPEDALSISATGTFSDKNAGVDKIVTISGLVLGGVSIDNYKLASEGQQTTVTANITQRYTGVTSLAALNKEYDGTTDATIDCSAAAFSDKIEGDDLGVSAKGYFAGIAAGNSKLVTIFDVTLIGQSADNYALVPAGTQSSTSANILRKNVVISGITAGDKVYDQNTSVTLNFSGVIVTGLVGTETLSVTATGAFADVNAGENKTVNISGLVLEGGDVSNYQLAAQGQQTSTTATITKKTVLVFNISAINKIYDGTTAAELNCSEARIMGRLAGDEVTVSAIGEFSDANAGVDKTVTITGFIFGGTHGGNYMATSDSYQTFSAATISKRDITVSGIVALDKEYDRGKTANLFFDDATLAGKIESDTLTVNAEGRYADANIGKDKIVTISGLRLIGSDNYKLASEGQQTNAISSITERSISISGITAISKLYDGTAAAELVLENAVFDGILWGDELTITATGQFADANVGLSKTVSILDLTLGGPSIGNYKLANTDKQQTVTAADITPRTITVSSGITAVNREYDGTANIQLDFTAAAISGVLEGDTVTVSATGTIADPNIGSFRFVKITDFVFGGTHGGNYIAATMGNQTSTDVTISVRNITVSGITVKEKAYDGTVAATADCSGIVIDRLIPGDKLEVTVLAAFEDENAGYDKDVNIVIALTGGESLKYYKLADSGQQTSAKGDIIPLAIGSAAEVTLGPSLTYNGKEQTQTVIGVIFEGFDVTYTVDYNSVVDAGDYALVITGNGNFGGAVSKDFTVAKAANKVTIERSSSCIDITYDVKAKAYGIPLFVYTITEGNDKASVDSHGYVTGLAAGDAVLKVTAVEQTNYLSATESFAINVHDHSVTIAPGKAATATQPGLTVGYYCSECGTILVPQKVIEPTGSGDITITSEGDDMIYDIPDSPGINTITIVLNENNKDKVIKIYLPEKTVNILKGKTIYVKVTKLIVNKDSYKIDFKVNDEDLEGPMYITMKYDPAKGTPSVWFGAGKIRMGIWIFENERSFTFSTDHGDTYDVSYSTGVSQSTMILILWLIAGIFAVIVLISLIVLSRPEKKK